jgi:cytochrome c
MVPGLPASALAGHFAVPPDAGTRVAIAPPYGPPLRDVYGRPAGSVAGFPYSQAFTTAMHGVVWNRATLDTWITDSQARVPGSRMFYKQPDPEIRRKIITYLEMHR